MTKQRTISLTLSERQADALINAANRGVQDLVNSQVDTNLTEAEIAERVVGRLIALANRAWLADSEARG